MLLSGEICLTGNRSLTSEALVKLIVMLGGGDKDSQESDIAEAKQRKSLLED